VGSLLRARRLNLTGFFYARKAGPVVDGSSLTREEQVGVGVRWGSALLLERFALGGVRGERLIDLVGGTLLTCPIDP
jgi:hypothetical protein